ncbi:hypothetical protein GL279_18260 [Paracoccus limosus]|uniref:Fumarate reductase/succinate dehydrogenase flavoprotein-like C-terminal domain-containing protein n=2 Tax=Paracoccus limosus TaxID=913252 RepID=A0A844H9B7_9RHOB|nr:hypothetical protein [Paracoccus limosus]
MGIDPFAQKFEVEPMFEGSVRGSGGVLVTDESCGTGVRGLWVAGDAASREMLVGASSGAGSVNASWALSSGRWAGAAAAAHARSDGVGLRANALWQRRAGKAEFAPAALLASLQAEMLPLSRNGFRDAAGLARTLAVVAGIDAALEAAAVLPDARQILRQRELLSMALMARRGAEAALLRAETRGVHVRQDLPASDLPQWRQRIVWNGMAAQPERHDIVPFREDVAA